MKAPEVLAEESLSRGKDNRQAEEEDEEVLRRSILQMDVQGLGVFIRSHKFTEQQSSLSLETIRILTKKILDCARETAGDTKEKPGRAGQRMREFLSELKLFTTYDRQDVSTENFQDLFLRSVIQEISPEADLQAIYQFLNDAYLLDNDRLNPTNYYDSVAEALTQLELDYPDNTGDLRKIQALLSRNCNFYMQYKPEFFAKYFQETVMQKSADDPAAVSRLIEMVRLLSLEAVHDSGSVEGIQILRGLLLWLWERSDNYLIKKRCQTAFDEIESHLLYGANLYLDQEEEAEGIGRMTALRKYDSYTENFQLFALQQEGFIVSPMAKGLVGIYGQNGDLQRYVEDTPVDDMKRLTGLSVFAPSSDEKDTSQKESDKRDFLFLASLPIRQEIEQDFGVDLSALDVRVQQYFLNFLKSKPEPEVKAMADYVKEYGTDFFVTFLSLENGKQMGDAILCICQQLEPEAAREVFAKYAEFAEASEGVREYLREGFAQEFENNPGLENRVIERLLDKGQQVLLTASAESISKEEILHELQRTDVGLQLFANSFKVLAKAGASVDFEKFGGIDTGELRGGEIPQNLQDQLMQVADENWRQVPHMHAAIMEGLVQKLDDPSTKFHVVTSKDKIIGFFRLDAAGEREMYFGSVNVPTELQSFGLGSALLEQVFLQKAEGSRVTAHCNPWDAVSSRYIGDCGFVATKLMDYSGQWAFEIVRDDVHDEGREVPEYVLAGKPYWELVEASRGPSAQGEVLCYSFSQNHTIEGSVPENMRFVQEVKERLAAGYLITNFRYGPKNNNGTTPVAVAFETRASAESLSRSTS